MNRTHIADLCDQIVSRLHALGRPTDDLFLAGLTSEEICEATVIFPFMLPDSVLALYEWRNGTIRSGRDSDFFPGWRFVSLTEAMERYSVLYDPIDNLWSDRWFPLFSSPDISTYGVACKDVSRDDGEVVAYEYTLGADVEFESLEAMLETILKAYETGVYYLDEKGQLEVGEPTYDDQGHLVGVDMSRFNDIAKRFNPHLDRDSR